MSRHLAFRRQPVDQSVAQHLRTTTFPAPTRGIVQNENQAYMKPGGALIQDNWAPTMRGVRLRGGYIRWNDLHALDTTVPPVPSTARLPVISAFEYVTSTQQRIFAANASKLFDVTSSPPTLVQAGQTSGNYVATQFSNAAGDWMIAANEGADFLLRYNGTTWLKLDATGAPAGAAPDGASWITGPVDSTVLHGRGLSYVWKYRSRLFFIESGTMNAWYLGTDSVGGELVLIPLAGAATKGGALLFGAVWSSDAGSGTNDRCVFVTNLGEILIFNGSNPEDIDNWRQEGRYDISPPLGMNAHIQIAGDLLILTVDGIVPLSQAIIKATGQLELAMLTRTIKTLWRQEVNAKRGQPWTVKKWDEYGAFFVAMPGGRVGDRYCLIVNNATGAWARYGPNYDATCFIRLRDDMFFGTQDGLIMLAERTGYDDGNDSKLPYTAILVGGWEMFGAPSSQFVWHQARAAFQVSADQPFNPGLSSTVDNSVIIPPAPQPGTDTSIPEDDPGIPSLTDGWDIGKWGPAGSADHPPTPDEIVLFAQWGAGDSTGDVPKFAKLTTSRNTLWVSIGKTGFAHAPILQVTVAQAAVPAMELIAIAATYEPAGINV